MKPTQQQMCIPNQMTVRKVNNSDMKNLMIKDH